MNNGGEAADQMVREALQFSEVAIKLTALALRTRWRLRLPTPKRTPKCAARQALTGCCVRVRR